MEASIGFLLEKLTEFVLHHKDLIKGAEQDFDGLKGDLTKFSVILAEASRKSKKDEIFEEWETRMREAVYDIEDAIDTCLTEANAKKAKPPTWRWFQSTFKTIGLAKEVKRIRRETVEPLMTDFESAKLTIADETDTTVADATSKKRQQKSPHIVGLETEAGEFVDRLINESGQLEVLSVYGMPGLGKTTFARKVYEDKTIDDQFPLRIWVNISQYPNMRKVFLYVLSKLSSTKPEESVTDEELVTMIKHHLEDVKYLIVMDDIWTIDAWNILKGLLPTSNRFGRVIVTTRNTDVGFATCPREPCGLRFLTEPESWELLKYQAFGKVVDHVPEGLSDVGQSIANDCKGLPLSIVVIGGILHQKTSRSGANSIAIQKEWDRVSKNLTTHLAGDKNTLLRNIISLSYANLPYKLRNCFLYFGVFPEDADIPVKKLLQLWIAEELLHDTKGKLSLEEVALENLKEFINRNLVMVRKATFDGEPKICQIHDSIHKVCKEEGQRMNLFTEPQPDTDALKIRRLCIHSQALHFFSEQKRKLPKIRSFICSNQSPVILDGKDTTSIDEAFGLLRVYDAKDMKFKIFPAKLVQHLQHLRYLTLVVASDLSVLPESVTDLGNLQTLIVDTPSSTLEVKGNIWKMRHLRHVKTKASISLSKKGEDDNGGKELQTLSRLSPGSCTTKVCKKMKKLVTLGIQGDLRKLDDSKCFAELESLNKLKLVHAVSSGDADDINPVLKHLPDSLSFPPKIKILVLSGTGLNWAHMSTLSAIGTLEVLKLKEHAFQGINWEAVGPGFINLICLDIGRANLRCWKVSKEHFPKLKLLYINNCDDLLEIPTSLVKKLDVLSLEHVSEGAISSAQKIVDNELKKENRVIKFNFAAGAKK